jgi:hypothetical protein
MTITYNGVYICVKSV